MKQNITILGATGSIGASTLEVVSLFPETFSVFAVTAHTNVDGLFTICKQYQPMYAVMVCEQSASLLRQRCREAGLSTEVMAGTEAVIEVSEAGEVDLVMAAIVGAAGLAPTLAAVNAGKRVLLANKEALVMSGQLFMDAVARSGALLLPVDSEHNAIFQCLTPHAQAQLGHIDLAAEGISSILLTGSGGPFLDLPIEQLAHQPPQAACKHPNWSMGQKISVDSATMLNKGLEYIEARWLFNCREDQLNVIIHPQSVIHSMVQYRDGSVIAQLGQPDMKTPIAHCMHYPLRKDSGVAALDFTALTALTFAQPDFTRFPCLKLAQQACWDGQAATTALNAANEVAVKTYLQEQIQFAGITHICDQVLNRMHLSELTTIEEVVEFDSRARVEAGHVIEAMR